MNQLRLDGSLLSTLLHSVTLPVPSSTCSDQRTWRSPPTASMQHVSGCDAPIHGVSLGCRRRDNATSATSRPRRWVPQQHIVHILDVSEYKCVPIVLNLLLHRLANATAMGILGLPCCERFDIRAAASLVEPTLVARGGLGGAPGAQEAEVDVVLP